MVAGVYWQCRHAVTRKDQKNWIVDAQGTAEDIQRVFTPL